MDLRLIIVVLTVLQLYTVHSSTSDAPTTSVTTDSTTVTTGGTKLSSGVSASGVSASGVSASGVSASGVSASGVSGKLSTAATTTPKPLTCKTGTCTGDVPTCTAFKTNTTCTVGQVCGLTLGNGNVTINTYDFKCSLDTDCDKKGLTCCKTDMCMPGQTYNGSSHVHSSFVSVVIMLLTMISFL